MKNKFLSIISKPFIFVKKWIRNFSEKRKHKKNEEARFPLLNVTLPFTQEIVSYQKKFIPVLAVLFVIVIFYGYLYAKERALRDDLFPVYVAAKDLEAPHKIGVGDLQLAYYPRHLLPNNEVPKKSDMLGAVLMDSLVKNELILSNNFQRDTDTESIASSDLFKTSYLLNIDENWLMSPIPDIKKNDRVSVVINDLSAKPPMVSLIAANALVLEVTKNSLAINAGEEEITNITLARSMGYPMQILVQPNKDLFPDALDTSKSSREFVSENGEKWMIPTQVKFVKYGDKNDDVKNLQALLNALGYSIEVTGEFGEKTKEGVRWFQEKRTLTVTGILDPKTVSLLNEEMEELEF